MSANKRMIALILALLLTCGAACAVSGYLTKDVQTGSFTRKTVANGSVVYQNTENVVIRENATLNSIEAAAGQTVQPGDVIATYLTPMSASEIRQAEVNLTEAEDDYAYEISRREEAIAAYRASSEGSDPVDARIGELLARKEEMNLEQYRQEAEAKLDALRRACESAQKSGEPKPLCCSIDGVIYDISQIAEGTALTPGKSLAGIYAPETALIRVDNASGELKYGMKVDIQLSSWSNKTTGTGTVVSCDNVLPGALRTGMAYVLCESGSTAGYNNATVTAETMRVDDVMLATPGAVQYDNGHYFVQILDEEGTVHTRYVSRALESTGGVWLTGGVQDGDRLITK